MYNKTFLIGRLTRDPEIRYTPSGLPIAKFTLAINRPTKDRETDFIRIVAWRRLAEICGEFLKKGRLIAIEGRLQFSSFQGNDGTPRVSAEVVADNMQMLERKPDSTSAGQSLNVSGEKTLTAVKTEEPIPF